MRFAAKLGIVLLLCHSANAAAVLHKFQVWDLAKTKTEKLLFYLGWTNGFLQARGPEGAAFANCLESMESDQAVAMIDKYYADHPERWSRPLGEQLAEALTVEGGPCAGKNPLK
jgi:hypothetical protein